MNDSTILENKPIFFCETCNYGCNYNSGFMKHLKSDKHNRHGEKKIFKCDKCDYKTNTSHWNLKMHYATVHSSTEERKNYKYYCNKCDLVFFCEAYYNKHVDGIRHKNMVKAIDLQLKINEI